MFDIGFLELLVIGVIALIVLGPERLPKAARTLGLWVGKAKQSFNAVKTEIDRELRVQELQKQLKEEKAHLKEQVGLESAQDTLSEAQKSLNQINHDLSAYEQSHSFPNNSCPEELNHEASNHGTPNFEGYSYSQDPHSEDSHSKEAPLDNNNQNNDKPSIK